jgi:hypothetical protein
MLSSVAQWVNCIRVRSAASDYEAAPSSSGEVARALGLVLCTRAVCQNHSDSRP